MPCVYYRPDTWYDVGMRFLVFAMVGGLIIGGIFTSHGNPYGIMIFAIGIIATFMWFEIVTRKRDYRDVGN